MFIHLSVCVRTHTHTLTHIRRMHFLYRIFYVNFRKKSGYLLVLIFKFLSKTRAWQNYRFYNFIVILHALLWPILWLLPVVSFMATQSLKVFVYCSQSHTKWLPILKLSQWNDSTWTTALELTKRCDLDEISTWNIRGMLEDSGELTP